MAHVPRGSMIALTIGLSSPDVQDTTQGRGDWERLVGGQRLEFRRVAMPTRLPFVLADPAV